MSIPRRTSGCVIVEIERVRQGLDASTFVRSHRSHLVTIDHAERTEDGADQGLRIRLRGGAELQACRAGSGRLRQQIGS